MLIGVIIVIRLACSEVSESRFATRKNMRDKTCYCYLQSENEPLCASIKIVCNCINCGIMLRIMYYYYYYYFLFSLSLSFSLYLFLNVLKLYKSELLIML